MKRISGDDVVAHVLRDHPTPQSAVAARCSDRPCPAMRWMIVLGFACVMLATGAVGVFAMRPTYAGDHDSATVAELVETMRRHADPRRREEARSILIHRAVDCVEAVRGTITTMHAEKIEAELDQVRAVLR